MKRPALPPATPIVTTTTRTTCEIPTHMMDDAMRRYLTDVLAPQGAAPMPRGDRPISVRYSPSVDGDAPDSATLEYEPDMPERPSCGT